jgi:hypothetical protein
MASGANRAESTFAVHDSGNGSIAKRLYLGCQTADGAQPSHTTGPSRRHRRGFCPLPSCATRSRPTWFTNLGWKQRVVRRIALQKCVSPQTKRRKVVCFQRYRFAASAGSYKPVPPSYHVSARARAHAPKCPPAGSLPRPAAPCCAVPDRRRARRMIRTIS